MNFLTKSAAIFLKYATIVCLLQIAIASGATAKEGEKTLQEIVDLPDSNAEMLQKLEKHSELGSLLSEYILVFDKLGTNGNFELRDSFPTDVIPNYLALRAISELQQDAKPHTRMTAFASLLKVQKKYNLLDETGALFNLLELTVKIDSSSDPVSESLRIKNLRYISHFADNKWSDIYFKKLKRAKGWVVNREVGYWKTQLDIQSCKNAKRVNDCILELAKNVPKKKFEIMAEIEKIFCEVKLISEGEILEVSLCD